MSDTDIYPLFLELLRSALWKKPADPALFHNLGEEAWQSLFEYSITQSATALVVDGISTLPLDCVPPRQVSIDMLLSVDNVEEANAKLNRVLAKVSDDYVSQGLPFILLKGQGNALYYPDPTHRSPGDIDLFFYRDGDCEKAKRWAEKNGYPFEKENVKHSGYHYDGLLIEIHHAAMHFLYRKYNKRFRNKVEEIVRDNQLETIQICDTIVKVFPAEWNAFYVFAHLFHHFISNGIGLKQVCDWLLMLSARRNDIDKERFTAMARRFDLLKPMRVFARLGVKYLGASPDIFPFELGEDSRFTDLVMDDVLRGGNFGYHRAEYQKHKLSLTLKHKWYNYSYRVSRAFLFVGMSFYHIALRPLYEIYYFFERQCKKKMRNKN
jgi:hypothetical protein